MQKLHVVHTTIVTNPATWYYLIWGDTLYFAYFYMQILFFFTYKNYCLLTLPILVCLNFVKLTSQN